MKRDPLTVRVPTALTMVTSQVREKAWFALSARDRSFLVAVVHGEGEYGESNFGVVATSGGDASTIRSLERRGLLEYLDMIDDDEGHARRGYTLTQKARDIAMAGLGRERAKP